MSWRLMSAATSLYITLPFPRLAAGEFLSLLVSSDGLPSPVITPDSYRDFAEARPHSCFQKIASGKRLYQ
jgi:hypothetical protein